MNDRHYDGHDPHEPLPDSHFSEEEHTDARRLGDGSPAVEPRRKDSPDEQASGSETDKP